MSTAAHAKPTERSQSKHGSAVRKQATAAKITIDQETIDHLPSPLHKIIADLLVAEGSCRGL